MSQLKLVFVGQAEMKRRLEQEGLVFLPFDEPLRSGLDVNRGVKLEERLSFVFGVGRFRRFVAKFGVVERSQFEQLVLVDFSVLERQGDSYPFLTGLAKRFGVVPFHVIIVSVRSLPQDEEGRLVASGAVKAVSVEECSHFVNAFERIATHFFESYELRATWLRIIVAGALLSAPIFVNVASAWLIRWLGLET